MEDAVIFFQGDRGGKLVYAHNQLVGNDKIIGDAVQAFYFCHNSGLAGYRPGRDLQNIILYLIEPPGIMKAGYKGRRKA